MEHFATDFLFPDYRIWEQYTTETMAAAFRFDSLRSSHPIQVPISRAEDVEQVFDAISYCKGSTVVRMVAAILGPDKFREGLQAYMRKHQYSNTDTMDLWCAWKDASGIDIPTVMTTWTQQMGHPYLTVLSEQWTSSTLTIELEQNWFLADGGIGSEDKLWNIPIVFATSTDAGDAAVSYCTVMMNDKRQTFLIPVVSGDHDNWVKINAGQQALLRVAHSSEMISRLLRPIRQKSLPPIDRASLLLDTFALAKAGHVPIEETIALLRASVNEDSFTVWSAIASVLRGLSILMEHIGGIAFQSFQSFGAFLVKVALEKFGWEHKSIDDHDEKLTRTTVISLLDAFGGHDEVILKEARRRFHEHWENPSALHSDFKVPPSVASTDTCCE
jgi:puromycin-sensitive aminopeptidase